MVYASHVNVDCLFRKGVRACGYIRRLEGQGLRVWPPSVSRLHIATKHPHARRSSQTMGICERWDLGYKFISCCNREQVSFACLCVEGGRFMQVVRVCMSSGRLCGVAVRSVARSCAPALFCVSRDRFAVTRELGERIILRVWCSFWLPGILWLSRNNYGGLAQGRKPHGGSERPCNRPPLTFLRGGGPRPLE